MMNEPEENDFSHKIHIKAYPTVELGGIVWAYMGPPEKMPPSPKFAWTQVPEAQRNVTKVIQESNWLQGLEGGHRHPPRADHAPRCITENTTRGGFKPSNPFVAGKAPKLVVDLTNYGYQYAGVRSLGETQSTSAPIISSCRSIGSGLRSPKPARQWTPAISGCRWMTRTPWCSTGSSAKDGSD